MKPFEKLSFVALLAFCCVLLGTAVRYYIFDSPLRVIFWSEKWMKPLVVFFGSTWDVYSNSVYVDQYLALFSKCFAIALFGIVLYVLYRRAIGFGLTLGISICFVVFTLLNWKEHFYHVPFLMELAIYCITPYLLYASYKRTVNVWFIKLAIATTFVGHGVYALNLLEIPADFVQMVMNVFAVTEAAARELLKIMGVFDFLAALLLFFPLKGFSTAAIYYCIIWGILTAFARLVGHYHGELGIHTLDEYWHETLIRLPNGLVPLWLFLAQSVKKVDPL